MDRTDAGAVSQGGLQNGRWTGRQKGSIPQISALKNGTVYHLVSEEWSMEPLDALTGSVEHTNQLVFDTNTTCIGKKVRRFCLN